MIKYLPIISIFYIPIFLAMSCDEYIKGFNELPKPKYMDHSNYPISVDDEFIEDEGIIVLNNGFYLVSSDWLLSIEALHYQFQTMYKECVDENIDYRHNLQIEIIHNKMCIQKKSGY